MEEYPIEIVDNQIIVLINGNRVLLDTGSPNSIGDGRTLSILGRNYNFTTRRGFSIDQINILIGTQINVLLGGDVLTNLNFFVNWDTMSVTFSLEPLDLEGTHIPFNFFMTIPVVSLRVVEAERDLKAFLDTGAKLSYLDPDITRYYNSIGTAQDFYPNFGSFETNIYEVSVMLDNHTFTIIAGNLPDNLQRTLLNQNTRGILGNDIFRYFNVCFNFNCNNAEIILIPRNNNIT